MSDTDPPQHVAETLDGARDDWSGPDAMRWSPHPPPPITFPRAELRDLPTPAPWPDPPSALEELRQWVHLSVEQFGRAVEHIHWASVDAGLVRTPPPADPRERALWAARRRGTGPTTPAAGKAHRPRRHQ